MKKEKVGEGVLFVFSCIAIGIIVAAAFLGSLEEQYQKNKAWERQFLPRITEDFSPVLDFQVTTPDLTDMFPSGDYILLRNVYGTNLFHLSFFLDDKEVCHWDTETAHPYSFQERELSTFRSKTALEWEILLSLGIFPKKKLPLTGKIFRSGSSRDPSTSKIRPFWKDRTLA